jgi:DNA invertase Pin-like site-specific DNA recombinase
MQQPEHLSREGHWARAGQRELLKMLKALVPGAVVTVTRIDLLGRSIFDLFAIIKQNKGRARSQNCHNGMICICRFR